MNSKNLIQIFQEDHSTWIKYLCYGHEEGEDNNKCYQTNNIVPKAVESKHLVSAGYTEDSGAVTTAYIEQKTTRDLI